MPDKEQSTGNVNISNITADEVNIGPIVTGTVIGDVIGGDKYETHIHQPLPPAEAQTRRDLGILLKNVETTWIEGVLENSVHAAVWLDLGKESRAEAVDHPWQMVLEGPDQARQALPPEKKIKAIFEEANRLLLILGDPGSGKTTTLLQLARDLIIELKQDSTFAQAVPVIFNLSTWTDKQQRLEEWLVAELSSKYRAPKKVGRRWFEERRILPLLDGLDEVKAENRAACIEQINRLATDYGLQGVVVCSRIKDYTALDVRLAFYGAIYLQPLTDEQLDDYFNRAGDKLKSLRTTLQQDEALQSLAQSPLMLNIMSLAYQDTSAEELRNPALATDEARRTHLFDTYIDKMFKRKGKGQPYDDDQTKQRLSWLARNMQRHNQEVFLIEGLQPSWLQVRHWRTIYILTSRLIGGLMFGVLVWLIGGLSLGLIIGMIVGLPIGFIDLVRFEWLGKWIQTKTSIKSWWLIINVAIVWLIVGLLGGLFWWLIELRELFGTLIRTLIFGLPFGLIFGLRGGQQSPKNDIKAVESLYWSWRKALKGGVMWGLIGEGLFGLLNVMPDTPTANLSNWLFVGLISVALGAVFNGLSREIIETKTTPNQGIWLSTRNAVLGGLIVGFIVLLLVSLFGGLSYDGLSVGLISGLFGALWYGGLDIIQHYTLRLILIIRGHTSRNYARFLDYGVERIFLQKVGGGYRFIHRLLLEHFAAMEGE